jgi:hypothetical protein
VFFKPRDSFEHQLTAPRTHQHRSHIQYSPALNKIATNETPVQLPSGHETVTVKLINPVNFGPAILNRFMGPDVPGLGRFKNSPSFSFLLEHPSGRKLVWDLGIRKDYQNYSPKITEYLPTTGYTIEVSQNVADVLEEAGISPASVEAVIWRFVVPQSTVFTLYWGRR